MFPKDVVKKEMTGVSNRLNVGTEGEQGVKQEARLSSFSTEWRAMFFLAEMEGMQAKEDFSGKTRSLVAFQIAMGYPSRNAS